MIKVVKSARLVPILLDNACAGRFSLDGDTRLVENVFFRAKNMKNFLV